MGSFRNILNLQFQGFLGTPPLWKDSGPIDIPQYLTLQTPEIRNVEDHLLVPENLILGKRMEIFFAFYVKHFTSDYLVAQNIVVSEEKNTIGEIDFLLLDEKKEEYIHVELVYKYYLYDPKLCGDLDPWIGPNRKDSLEKKLLRLKNHQFPLLYRKESRKVTEVLQLPLEKIIQKVCFKANLFVPLKLLNNKFSGVNNDCIKGYWIRIQDFQERDYGSFHFHTPKKPNWPIDPLFCEEWYDFAEIKEQLLGLLQAKRSPLVWMKTPDKEYKQFFVVWW